MSNDGGFLARQWKTICIVAAIVISAAGWARLRPDSSLLPMLPEDSDARRTVQFLNDSSFGYKAILWFRLTGNGTLSDLYAAADATEKRLDPHIIKSVLHPPAEASAMDQAIGLLDDAGMLLNQNDLSDIAQATTPTALAKRMRECYLQLLKPSGSFMARIIRRDPLGVSTRILSRLLALTNGLGYRVEVRDGYLVHSDGRQLMMVLETYASATSLQSSREIAEHLEQVAAAAPPGVQIIPICAQIHTQQNDALMRRDVRLAGIINTIAFLLLFVLISRDFRVAAVFLLPLATTAIAIGWCALVRPTLSTMMLGLAVTMAGSAVDYGIFVYTAVTMGAVDKTKVGRVWRPLVISHLTTLGVFIAFLFSKIPAFRQLGYLTSLSLVMSLLAAIFILPKLIRPGGRLALLGRGAPLIVWGKIMVTPTIVCALLLIAALFWAGKIAIDPDVTRLDGASAVVKQNEIDFQKTWGRGDRELAIVVVTGKTRAEAETANDQVYSLLSPHFAEGQFVSLSSFWPSESTRQENLARWRAFWSPRRIAELRTNLAAAGAPYDFSADAFDPFFQSLTAQSAEDQSRQIISSIEGQFIATSSNGDYQMLNYMEDTPENARLVRSVIGDRPDAEIVSRGALSRAFAESASSETRMLVSVSVAFILISLLALTGSFVKSMIIMLPAATGIVAMLAVLVLMGMQMSIVTLVAAILVLALGSDYGVFALYAWDRKEPIFGPAMSSVLLSFLTTFAGTGAMLLAHHPALFLVGVSMTSGLIAAFLTAFIMIPAIGYLSRRQRSGAA
jgi:predicted exporter